MRIIAAILTLFLSIVATGEQEQNDFNYGERPKNSIHDPGGVLTPQEREQISKPLLEILKNEKVDVLVVILREIGDAPPEHVAKGFADVWAKSEVNSVVLHVPGMEGSPWIFPGGHMTNVNRPDELRNAITSAQMRSAAEATDFGKVRAASTEASDILRYWKGGAMLWNERVLSHRKVLQSAFNQKRRRIKLMIVIGAAAFIPLVVGLTVLSIRIRNSMPRYFPKIKVMSRLGAPFAGGNSCFSNNGRYHPTK